MSPAIAPCVASVPDPNVLHWIPPADLTIRSQVRRIFDAAGLSGLADNIRQHGVIQPIVCFLEDGEPIVLDGERRVRASILAALSRVPVRLLTDPLDVAKVRARQLAANLQRADLNLVEQAEGIQAFIEESGQTSEQAAAELGISPAKVCRTLSVNRLAPEHKELIIAGKLGSEAAYLLARVDDAATRDTLAQRSAKGELTRSQLAREVQTWEAAKAAPAKDSATPDTRKPARTKAAVWRMTRSIGLGVALAVTGTGLTLEELVTLLDAFVLRAREAITQRVPVARFLSEFRHDVPTSKGLPS